MAYILNKTNGSAIATISNGSIDQSTDLVFVGKNYAGYGQSINEDLLKLLENFSNSTAPEKPITGQLWYDTSEQILKLYDGSIFRSISASVVSADLPSYSAVNVGDFWWDTQNGVLNVFSGSEFISIGPKVTGLDNFFQFNTVIDNTGDVENNTHTIIEHKVYNSLVAVVSTSSFHVGIGNPVDDIVYDSSQWQWLRKGITLVGADPLTGVSSNGIDSGALLWGTAADALSINGMAASTATVNNSIVSRGNAGEVYATTFHGTATSALYADLAERYHADAIYDEGTVLVIGGLNEVTVTSEHANVAVAGIVSKKPAFMMNSGAGTDETHPFIALKGRIPCKVSGTVLKGDILVTSTIPGYACVADLNHAVHPAAIIGKALESNSQGFGIIEVKV